MTAEKDFPQVRPLGPPESVPVFNCVLFVRSADGTATARVANIPDLVVSAPTEREAIVKAVTTFKSRISTAVAAGEKPHLMDGPWSPEPGEEQRLIAVHL